ncbi:hypothetical protein RCH06_001846 [Polaromonas sp. CG_9.5]|uniref:hypothetical protein n=1 Tax=Polaromonas sp. CG_9.5 TaxID=3071705 RepID=UPI002E07800D|nr:hypothetical protein [Polaromonas sp. CG_9.5]
MKKHDPFDALIARQKSMPEHIRESAIELTDTLNVCRAAVESVFGEHAKPEHALALLAHVMERADGKHQRLLARFGRDMDGEALPPSDTP